MNEELDKIRGLQGLTFFHCKNHPEKMVISTTDGTPLKYCKDCMYLWVQKQLDGETSPSSAV